MDISFENTGAVVYREIAHQVKRIQESAESVVPDTNDDIGRIASVQSSLLLKSKDITSRGVLVTGEATAMLLYITENESSVAALRLTKSFEMEYEIADVDADALAQIRLSVTNTEARVLNPRKVSVTLELAGELSCYRPETMPVETTLPPEACEGLHAKYETAEAVVAGAVCEKTFAFNEQFSFPAGKPAPSQLASQRVDFCVSETQNVGSKLIVKGTVNVAVCYLSNEVNYPLYARFSAPFSQIVDTGEENMASCGVVIELTSAYYDLIETINGEKALDTELHAVVQTVSRRRQELRYVSDVYCNRMPSQCSVQSGQIGTVSDMLRTKLSAGEMVNIAEDCEDVLSVFTAASQVTAVPGKFSAAVSLDVIYRTKGGSLSSARRLLNLEGEGPASPSRVLGAHLSETYLRPDGPALDCRVELELVYQNSASMELNRVTAVSLDEEAPYDWTQLPTVTLVRPDRESLWELAKRYHSSVEGIAAMNDIDQGFQGKLLLIPKLL